MDGEIGKNLKVGLFVFVTMALIGAGVYILGGGSEMFEERYKLNADFQDVAGLRVGSAVRLAGIDIGEVSQIRFSEDLGVKEIFVELTVMDRYQDRIRTDSLVRIETEGMLGNKYLAVSVGSANEEILENGEWIEAVEQVQLVEYQKQANRLLADMEGITAKVNSALGEDEEADEASVSNVVSSVENILKEAETGNGLIHALVYDKRLTRKLDNTVANLEKGSSDLASMTEEIRTGDSIAHELIYGQDGEKLATQLAELANALEKLVGDIENEDSVVHALIYDADKAQMVADLAVTSAKLRTIAEGIEEGDGTIGLLAKDPALYEDLRALVNGAERNKLLRYYVRKTVEDGEAELAEPWQE